MHHARAPSSSRRCRREGLRGFVFFRKIDIEAARGGLDREPVGTRGPTATPRRTPIPRKGDRSHKEKPAIPCPSGETCLRALSLASYLLDLMDLDENAAPQIRGVRADGGTAVELETLRASSATEVFIDGSRVAVTSRDGDVLRVELSSQSGTSDIFLVDGRRRSPAVRFTRQKHAEMDSFHVVEGVGLSVYDAATAGAMRAHKAVRLRSYEGGRSFIRYFPAGRSFAVDEYVAWNWRMSDVSPESWIDGSSSTRKYAWTSSAFFTGPRLAARGTPALVAIELRPREVRLRPGERAPVRVFATFCDGPARWKKDISDQAVFESLDPDILLVTGGPALHAKKGGKTQLRARFAGHFSSAPVTVAALPQGTVVEWLGGYQRTVGLMDHRDGFLITLQSDYLLAVRPSMNVEPAAYFDIPETVPSGIDVFAANPHGDLYARTLWHREVVELPHASGFSKSARIATADEGTAVMALAWSSQLDGLLIGDSAGRIQLWRRGGETETWVVLPFVLVALYPTAEALYFLPGGGRIRGYGRIDWADRTVQIISPPGSASLFGAALLPREHDILLANASDGRVYSIGKAGARVSVFAEGFTGPLALALDKHGSVFVANFGGDSISRVLP